MASTVNLRARGYVESEFLFSGTAQAYVNAGDWGADGHWATKPNPGATASYKTRMIVRRPTDPARFNGTVIVEWLNVTAGFDLPQDWAWVNEELIREGYAYVGVTAQHIGGLALQDWEDGAGDRYAQIFHPGDSFAYDIFSQAAQAIEHPRPGDAKPLGDLTGRIRAVLADGESQSAGYLFTYVNAVHPLARVYDGFLIHSAGYGNPLSMDIADFFGSPIPPGVPATPWVDTPYPAGIRSDLKTPVLVFSTEADLTDFIGAGRSVHRQRDAKTVRFWEVTGTAHNDQYVFDGLFPDIQKSFPGQETPGCDAPPLNPGVTHAYALRAALHALNNWVRLGIPAPIGPRISIDTPVDGDALINRLPQTGIALGGIRLPEVAVPVATIRGDRPDGAFTPPQSCFILLGSYDPWNGDADSWDGQVDLDPSPTPEPDLQLLYSSREDYVRKVTQAAAHSTLSGYLRPRDALTVIKEALRSRAP